jgi:uncharacterized protein
MERPDDDPRREPDRGREIYRFLRDECGARFMQFIPIIERATPDTLPVANEGWGEGVRGRPLYTQEGNLLTERSISPDGYGRFLDRRVRGLGAARRRRGVRADVRRGARQLARRTAQPLRASETCGLALAIEHTGDLYSCDHFVEPAFKLGNIKDTHMIDLIASPQQRKFGLDKRDTLPRFCQ